MKSFKYLSLLSVLTIVSCGPNGGNQENAQTPSEESTSNETVSEVVSQQASQEKKVNWEKPLFSINENKDTTDVWSYNEKGLLVMHRSKYNTTTYTYDNRDSILCIDHNGKKDIYEYGENGRLKKMVSYINEVDSYEYFDKKIITTHEYAGYTSKNEFEYADNDYKQLLKRKSFGEYGSTTTYEYYPDGRLKCLKYSGSGNNNQEEVTTYEYDAKNRLIKEEGIEYVYDDNAKTKKKVEADGRMYTVYDELGREIEFYMEGSEGLEYTIQYFDNYSVKTGFQKTVLYEDNQYAGTGEKEINTTTYYLVE